MRNLCEVGATLHDRDIRIIPHAFNSKSFSFSVAQQHIPNAAQCEIRQSPHFDVAVFRLHANGAGILTNRHLWNVQRFAWRHQQFGNAVSQFWL